MKTITFLTVFVGLVSSAYAQVSPSCFTPVSTAPVISKGNFFTGATWNDPHVLKLGNQFVMYASADRNFDQNIRIFRLVSTNGTTWSLSPKTPVLSRGATGTWDAKSVETPAVVRFKNLYYMFYTGYPESQEDTPSYKIGVATSKDGVKWTKRKTPLLKSTFKPGDAPNLKFDQYGVAEPAPVVIGNKIYLYFSALGANSSVSTTLQTIGLITSSDGTTWSTPRQVLVPDQTIYPRGDNWKGYSTPNAIVLNNKVHLFYDVLTDVPFSQVHLHHSSSTNGITGWTQDSSPIHQKTQFSWTQNQIRAPSALLNGSALFLYFAGDSGVDTLGIGLSKCSLKAK